MQTPTITPLYIFAGFLIAAIVFVRILRRRSDEQ